MPGCARREIVRQGEVGVYHCWSRCVRGAFLCGNDPVTGKNFDHRRDLICQFERRIAGLFGIEVAFHAELSNHIHLVLRLRPDVVVTWSDEDVARRWLSITRLVRSQDGDHIREPTDEDIATETADPARMLQLRDRLACVSNFMGALCEHIARRSNIQDRCRGHFWEDRFKCRNLACEAAILICGIYVDLNQIRAGEALTPEASVHTSAHDRIEGQRQRLAGVGGNRRATRDGMPPVDGWLCELTLQEGVNADVRLGTESTTPWRASDKGLLPIRLEDYLQLLDWSGRAVRDGKSGSIPNHLAPILDRLGINKHLWTDLVMHFDSWFGHIVGRAHQVVSRATAAGRHWYQGRSRCAEAFG